MADFKVRVPWSVVGSDAIPLIRLHDNGDGTHSPLIAATVSSAVMPNLDEVLAEGNDAGGAAITNLDDPTGAQDAATKAYVDSRTAVNVPLVSPEVTDADAAVNAVITALINAGLMASS